MRKPKLTETERIELVVAVKQAAVSLALVWDVLRQIEERIGKAIQLGSQDDDPISFLAGETNHPPSTSDLSDRDVWGQLANSLTFE